MGAPQVIRAWEDEGHPSAPSMPRSSSKSSWSGDGLYAPLTIFLTTLSNRFSRKQSKTNVETIHWTKAAAPPTIKRGPPPLTPAILNQQPMNLREAHFPEVYCKAFTQHAGDVVIEKNVVMMIKPKGEEAPHGVVMGNGLAPLARAVDPSSHSYAKIVQRGRLVQLKVEALDAPRFNASSWFRWFAPESENKPSFLGGMSIGLARVSELCIDWPLELHPDAMCVADDLSVWVMGEKVRDRFDAKYTDQGILFEHLRQGQIVSVLFTINRVVLYGDKWPLLSFSFDDDLEYRRILSDNCPKGRVARLDGDVWPIVQLTSPTVHITWHPDNPKEPLRALQFHRLMAKDHVDVQEGLTLADGFAVRDMRQEGNWEPPTQNWEDRPRQGRSFRATFRSTWTYARRTFSHTLPSFLSNMPLGMFQWRKMEPLRESEREKEANAAMWRRITVVRWTSWAILVVVVAITHFLYFPTQDEIQPWHRTWVMGLIIILVVTLICLLPTWFRHLSHADGSESGRSSSYREK